MPRRSLVRAVRYNVHGFMLWRGVIEVLDLGQRVGISKTSIADAPSK